MEPNDVAEEQHRTEHGIRGWKGFGQHERTYILVCHGGEGEKRATECPGQGAERGG